jgi:hypothetical protein
MERIEGKIMQSRCFGVNHQKCFSQSAFLLEYRKGTLNGAMAPQQHFCFMDYKHK